MIDLDGVKVRGEFDRGDEATSVRFAGTGDVQCRYRHTPTSQVLAEQMDRAVNTNVTVNEPARLAATSEV